MISDYNHIPEVGSELLPSGKPRMYIETYGCQMNVADSEVVAAILQQQRYQVVKELSLADVILINTCSIRENAENKIRNRLNQIKKYKKGNKRLVIGIIGCMAERLKEKIFEEANIVDLIAGPDSYRDLPRLIKIAQSGNKSANTLLSIEETYADISPVRLDENGVSAFLSIMRGCDNLCAYCVVPYTRGRERSRDPQSIIREAEEISALGYHEITLLGQNVNSYHWTDDRNDIDIDFSGLLDLIAEKFSDIRIRFSTSHPKDMSEQVIKTIASHHNICKGIHLPVQSGSTEVLKRMKRRYSREEYLNTISTLKNLIPDVAVSTDIIAGFPGETDKDHKLTLDLMKEVQFDFAYMFKYSERPGTLAARKYHDDVPEEVKAKRLQEIIALQNSLSLQSKKKDLGKIFEVLVESSSKKSTDKNMGRTSQNKVVVFPSGVSKPGQYVQVKVEKCTSATLMGRII